MDIKLIVFFAITPLIVVAVNSTSALNQLFTLLGYSVIIGIIGWEITSQVLNLLHNWSRWRVNPSRKLVLITGCDSGFGYLTARQLNNYGFTVVASCLFPEGEGAKQLRCEVEFPERLITIGLNVTKDEDIDDLYEQLSDYVASGYELWGLVNNAGIVGYGEAEWGTFEHNFGNVFDVNCFGVIKITRKCLPLIRRSKGRVVIISSIAGRITEAASVAYAMSKHAIVSFADGLRLSMDKFGVKVICIEPCEYWTPMLKAVEPRLEQLWQETDLSVREEYGEECYSKLVRSSQLMKAKRANMNPTEVSDAVLAAMISPFPNLRQICGQFVYRCVISFLSVIPTEFTHSLFQNF